jgi:endonuclease G, mitochondrial
MKAPSRIADAARKRVIESLPQIRRSVEAIEAGRPGDAETDTVRREQVYQARTGSTLEEARRKVARPEEGQERIFSKTVDFVDVAVFERGRRAARPVARIITRAGAAVGTGFLVSPRRSSSH